MKSQVEVSHKAFNEYNHNVSRKLHPSVLVWTNDKASMVYKHYYNKKFQAPEKKEPRKLLSYENVSTIV